MFFHKPDQIKEMLMKIINYYRGGTDKLSGFVYDTDTKTYKEFSIKGGLWTKDIMKNGNMYSVSKPAFKIPADIDKIRPDSEAETVVLTPSLHGKGKWTSEENDPLASCGKAVKLHTGHIQWAVQVKLLPLARYGRGGAWNIYARVRVETRKDLPPDARLFQTGCWNRKQLTQNG